MNPFEVYPLAILVLDYLLGIIMWTLLGRAVLDLFISKSSQMVIIVIFRTVTNPIIRLFDKFTPKFLVDFLIPVYVAWWFYMVRFYVIPYIFFGEIGVLSFPLEGTISQFLLSL